MAQLRQRQAFDPKVYRHFAVLTIAITGCIGLFASGEETERTTAKAAAAARTPVPDMRPQATEPAATVGRFGSAAGNAQTNVIAAPSGAALPSTPSSAPRPKRRQQTIFFSHREGNLPPPGPPTMWNELETQPQPTVPARREPTRADLNATLKASMVRSGRISNDIQF